jgi:hypothetical protein
MTKADRMRIIRETIATDIPSENREFFYAALEEYQDFTGRAEENVVTLVKIEQHLCNISFCLSEILDIYRNRG